MDKNFRQLDLQALIDLLAEETEKYSKASNGEMPEEVKYHRTIIDVLVTEKKIPFTCIYEGEEYFRRLFFQLMGSHKGSPGLIPVILRILSFSMDRIWFFTIGL